MSGPWLRLKAAKVLAGDLMERNVLTINADSTVRSAAELMAQRKVGSIAVTDGGEIIGIMTERDLLNKVTSKGLDPNTVKVTDVMSSPVLTIDAKAILTDAIETMIRKKVRRLLVTEEDQVVGILSQRDIHARVYRLFRSIA